MILDEIKEVKRKEVEKRKGEVPLKKLETSLHYKVSPLSMKEYLCRPGASGVIAEIKRRSPSKGFFKKDISVEDLSLGYMQAGASALSVLTDREFFAGRNEDVSTARRYNLCPILRKDFTIDSYQIHEAKAIGADVVLLIAKMLTKDEVKEFTACAHDLGLEVLLEIHDESELAHYNEGVDMLGVNNRDLTSFETSIETSFSLAEKLPKEALWISESGLSDPADVKRLCGVGYKGFLIGETFMKKAWPERACKEFVAALRE